MMVLFGHVQHEAMDLNTATERFVPFEPMAWGAGVDIFFIISGFIMYHTSAHRFGAAGAGWEFLKRRAIRLVPIYWLYTTAMLGALLVFNDRIAHNDVTVAHVVTSYLFLPWPRIDGDLRPILSLGWTLNYEVFFYLAFGAAMTVPRRRGLLLLGIVFGSLVIAGTLIPAGAWMPYFWTRPIILEFLFGVALAQVFRAGVRLSWPVVATMIVAGFGLMILVTALNLQHLLMRPLWAGIPALIICAGLALGPTSDQPLMRLASAAGDSSYSLYLSHAFTVNIVAMFWQRLSLGSPWAFVIVAIVASFVVAWASYRLLEQPALRWLRYVSGSTVGQPKPAVAQPGAYRHGRWVSIHRVS
jgi:exopolysaccharide production protein ExoZ